jgi:hypothetical protein
MNLKDAICQLVTQSEGLIGAHATRDDHPIRVLVQISNICRSCRPSARRRVRADGPIDAPHLEPKKGEQKVNGTPDPPESSAGRMLMLGHHSLPHDRREHIHRDPGRLLQAPEAGIMIRSNSQSTPGPYQLADGLGYSASGQPSTVSRQPSNRPELHLCPKRTLRPAGLVPCPVNGAIAARSSGCRPPPGGRPLVRRAMLDMENGSGPSVQCDAGSWLSTLGHRPARPADPTRGRSSSTRLIRCM